LGVTEVTLGNIEDAAYPVQVPICCQLLDNPPLSDTVIKLCCGPTKLEANVIGTFTVRLLPEPETVTPPVFTWHWLLLSVPAVPGATPPSQTVN